METRPLLGVDRLSTGQKAAYGFGHIHNDLCAAIWFSYSLIFYQLVVQAGPLLSGFLIFIGQAVDAVATPFAGYLVDQTPCSRKNWHLIGTVMSCVSFPMMFTVCFICNGTDWSIGLYYSIFISIFQCGWALVQISHLSILPEIADAPRDRAELTAYRYTATMASNVTVYLIAFGFFTGIQRSEEALVGPSDSSTFQKIAMTANLVGIATSMIFQLTTKRKPRTGQSESENKNGSIVCLRSKLTILCQSADVYKIAGVYTTSRLFLTITMEYIPLYVNQMVQTNIDILATVPLVLFVSSAVSSLLYDFVNGLIGQKITYFFGCFCSVMGCFLIFMHSQKSEVTMIFSAAVMFGVGSALMVIVSLSLAANLIGAQVECGAFIYSTVTFADKLINGIAVVLIQYLKCNDQEECPNYYRDVLTFLNSGSVIVGFILFLTMPTGLTRMTSH